MQFQVPQFIEVEDKIFGPLTLKQFIYLAGGIGIAILFYVLIPIKFIAIFLGTPFVVLGALLAFYKINNKPFANTLEAAVGYSMKSKLYIWKKTPKKIESKKTATEREDEATIDNLISPRLSDSKLKELAWSLDVNEQVDRQKFRNLNPKLSQFANEKEDVEFKKNFENKIMYGS